MRGINLTSEGFDGIDTADGNQKSGEKTRWGRLVSLSPLFYKVSARCQVVFFRISEPSTVHHEFLWSCELGIPIQGRGDTPKWYIPGTQLTFFFRVEASNVWVKSSKIWGRLGSRYIHMHVSNWKSWKDFPLEETNSASTTKKSFLKKIPIKSERLPSNKQNLSGPIKSFSCLFFYTHISSVHQKSRQNKEKHHQKRRFWKIPRFFSPEN